MRRLLGNYGSFTNKGVTVQALSPNNAGPCYRYEITGLDLSRNPSFRMGAVQVNHSSVSLVIADSDITPDGQPNGVTVEALVRTCADHLEASQQAPRGARSNEELRNEAAALERVQAALLLLQTAAARKPTSPIQPEVPLFQYAS